MTHRKSWHPPRRLTWVGMQERVLMFHVCLSWLLCWTLPNRAGTRLLAFMHVSHHLFTCSLSINPALKGCLIWSSAWLASLLWARTILPQCPWDANHHALTQAGSVASGGKAEGVSDTFRPHLSLFSWGNTDLMFLCTAYGSTIQHCWLKGNPMLILMAPNPSMPSWLWSHPVPCAVS